MQAYFGERAHFDQASANFILNSRLARRVTKKRSRE